MPRGWLRRGATIHAHVTVACRRVWKTFPGTTSDADIQLWRAKTRRDAGWIGRAGLPMAGTLAEDVAVYLDGFHDRHPETLAQRTRHLDAWAAAFKGRRRSDLTAREVEAQLRAWQREHGWAPATLNKRRQALYQLYAVLDRGSGLPNPVSAVPTFAVPDPPPRGIPLPLVAKLLARVPWPPTRARLTLMAYAGLRPEEVRRIQVGDWDATTLLVRSAKGGAVSRVPLLRPAAAALELLTRRGKLGGFTSAPMGAAMRAACASLSKTLKLTTPLHVTPYDLRHSYGTALYAATGDQRAAQAGLRHRSIVTTHRYTLAAVDPRLAAAVAAISAAIPALQVVEKAPRGRRNVPAECSNLKRRP
jgi:integrase